MSMTRALKLGAAAFVAAGVLSACSGGNSGGGVTPSATPSSDEASSSASSGSSNGAPSVSSPLPTDTLTSDPCQALASDQVTQIGLTNPGTSSPTDTGPSCKWRSATSQFNVVYISAITQGGGGLSAVYGNKPMFKYFEPTTVSGYPAVYADITDNRSGGYCQLWVGATDQLAVSVSTQIGSGPNKSNPCPIVEKVATAMIQHLQSS